MNKLTKGVIATTAGIVLLMGGAGTFAYWNDSVGITGGNIVAGNLQVVDATPADGVWTVSKDGVGTPVVVPAIASFTASPGDKFVYTKSVKITATGNDLSATLALAPGSIVATSNTTANNALAAYLTKTATISATGTGITASGANYTVTPGAAGITGQTVTVTVTINFPKDAAAGTENNTKLGSVNLTGLSVSLNQI
jgi:alternate signal-mediated exported protein